MENKIALYQKIFNVQQECNKVIKGEKNNGMKYNPVSYNSVTKVVKDALKKEKLIMIPSIDHSEQVNNQTRCSMSALIADCETGESVNVKGFLGYGNDTQDKGPGKAASYAYKYLMLKMFMLDIADQEDIELGKNQEDDESETVDFDAAEIEIKKMYDDDPSNFYVNFKESKWIKHEKLKLFGNKLRGL